MAHISQDERRDQLIAATIKVMRADGLDAVTTRRVSDAAGAPLASIHYCFGSLDELRAAAYGHVVDEVLGLVVSGVPVDRGFTAAFTALAERVGDLMGDERYCRLVLDLNSVGDQRLAALEARYRSFGPDLVLRIIEESGDLSAIAPEQLGRLLVAAIDGTVTQFAADRDLPQFRADLLTLTRLLGEHADR